MNRTQTELTAIFVFRSRRDNWVLVAFPDPKDKDHYSFMPPEGHPWRVNNTACQFLVLKLSGNIILIPSYAFENDPVTDPDLADNYAFIGGELDQKICSVSNPTPNVDHNGETYRKLKAGAVTFYAHQSMGVNKAVFLYYLATDNGVGHAKFSRN